MLHIQLTSNRWDRRDPLYARGVVDIGSLARTLDARGVEPHDSVPESLRGFFALVVKRRDQVFAAVDRVRSIPLFYGSREQHFYLSDEAEWVRAHVADGQFDSTCRDEFLLAGYVTGEDTLFPGVKQLRAGQWIVAKHGDERPTLRTGYYYRFQPQSGSSGRADRAALLLELNAVTDRSMARLVDWANGRPIVIPLSAGYDSRLLAAKLKAIGYPSVATYTYGRAGNVQSRTGRQVARALELPWRFVEYSNERWNRWYHTPERVEYFRTAYQYASVPHVQDWPAVWELRESGWLPEDAVVVPGHSGDFISGGHMLENLAQEKDVSIERLAQEVFDRHYVLWPSDRVATGRKALLSRIAERLEAPLGRVPGEQAVNLHERWDWAERQAKFIVNSVRVYEFWGVDWWLPLWDADMMDFWSRVPIEWRRGSSLYRDYVAMQYAHVAKVPIRDARRTDDTTPVALLKKLVRASPLAGTVGAAYYRRKRARDYSEHPMAWYGLLDRTEFMSTYTGHENINSFLARRVLEMDNVVTTRAPEEAPRQP